MGASYISLICSSRRRASEVKEDRDVNQESESDRGRFIFSSPMRRLQQKAQVYSLEDNAAVRSRLTHSFEVSQVGRYISQLILNKLRNLDTDIYPKNIEIAFINFVETACLMHDVGNPPFGHLGEYAIQEWFRDNYSECTNSALINSSKIESDKLRNEFCNFDGNCQGLRIITKLQWNNDEFGLNLTHTQILAYLKYVVHQNQADPKIEIKKKGGYFSTEEEIIKECWERLDMKPNTRHPLVYIMEAADDIAYSISDIEDAIDKGLIQLFDFLDYIESKIIEGKHEPEMARSTLNALLGRIRNHIKTKHLSPFIDFRTTLTRIFANYAAQKYLELHNDILNGLSAPIFHKDNNDIEAVLLTTIKEYAISKVYRTAAAADNELAGYSILRGILTHFKPLLSCNYQTFRHLLGDSVDQQFKANKLQKRLYALLPKKYLRVYQHATSGNSDSINNIDLLNEWSHRAHLVTDFISGMTDNFALETYQLLSGIKVGKTNITK